MTTCFEAVVNAVGREVPEFISGKTLIFFGPNVPCELQEVSVSVTVSTITSSPVLVPGHLIHIGRSVLQIREVGTVAEENLRLLTHLVLVTSDQQILPGQVRVVGDWSSLNDIGPGAVMKVMLAD